MARPAGYTSPKSPSFDDLLKADARPVPEALTAHGNYLPSLTDVPFSVYHDPGYAELEMQHVWSRCWQFACREEDIPRVGDRYTYDVGDLSFIIIRCAPGEFKALVNSCLHRGTRLCSGMGSGEEIKCPFHGWRWHVDGRLKAVPGKWDFPQVDEGFRLPEAQLDTWAGNIFINPDPDAGPLRDALGVLPEHFRHFDLADRYTTVKTAKKIRANWKTVWAAFLEAYHVAETHHDAMSFTGDANTAYDCYDTGAAVISRLITPQAVPSPYLGEQASARNAAEIMVRSFARVMGPGVGLPDMGPEQSFGRADAAQWLRDALAATTGRDFSTLCDSEMLDSIQYAMFPNFGPWLGEGLPLMYQFVPYGRDPNESLFVVRLLAPVPANGPRPAAAEMTFLDFDENFSEIPDWGRVAHVFDQDMANLPLIQQGMHSAAMERAKLVLGRHQEQRVALMHEFVEQQISERSGTTGAAHE